ncbi:MAG: Omp28-related outer membrane protein, partial [Bacteroidia bacterium]|nr:Omp28-related outer membrane protein [Bacteroidia bacterium]
LNRTQWLSNVNLQLGGNPLSGLAIETDLNQNTLDVTVHTGFRTAVSGDYRVTVYLIEQAVTGVGSGYDQMNYYNNDQSSPFYNMGNPIVGYEHDYVVRKTLSAELGDQVPTSAMVAGGEFVKSYTVNTSAYSNSNLKVLAFVNKVGNSSITHEIINAQQVKAGQTKDWD